MDVNQLIALLVRIDAGFGELLRHRRDAAGGNGRIAGYLDQAPRIIDENWYNHARAYLLVVRLMYTSALMELSEPPDETKTRGYLEFLNTKPSISQIIQAIRLIVERNFDVSEEKHAVSLRLHNQSRNAWAPEKFSDPTERPRKFRYVITGIRTDIIFLTPEVTQRYLAGTRGSFTTRTRTGGYFDNARYMLNLHGEPPSDIISCSLISDTKCKTYMNMCFGLILYVPSTNFLRAEPRDIESSGVQRAAREMKNENLSQLERMSSEKNFWSLLGGQCRETLPSPDVILEQTSSNGHNEIVVLGKYEESKVVASAVFVKTINGMIWQDFLGREGRIASVVLKEVKGRLPIIPIEDNSRSASNVSFASWLSGDTSPLGSIGSGQSCSKCGRVHGWMPSIVRRWHECSICRAIYCWACGWKLRYYTPTSIGEVLDLMDEDYYNPGVRACAYCGGRTRLV